jgi:hypothetical protein
VSVEATPVTPGQRRRSTSGIVWAVEQIENHRVRLYCAEHPMGPTWTTDFVSVVAVWPVVPELPALPEPTYCTVFLSGNPSHLPYSSLARAMQEVSSGYRPDLFIEWTPRFVDREGRPVEDGR